MSRFTGFLSGLFGWMFIGLSLIVVAETVARLDVPITVVYGTADTIVPPGQSETVAAAARRLVEKVALPGAEHNDPVMFGPPVVDALIRLAEAVPPPQQ